MPQTPPANSNNRRTHPPPCKNFLDLRMSCFSFLFPPKICLYLHVIGYYYIIFVLIVEFVICIASNKLCIQWNFKLVLIFFSFIRFMQYIQKHRNKITVESRLKKITGISTFLNHNSIISLSSIKGTKIWQTCYIRNIRLYCPHDKVLKIQTIIPLIWEYSIPG